MHIPIHKHISNIPIHADYPAHMSEAARSVLGSLLVRDPKMRLGSGERDAEEIKV